MRELDPQSSIISNSRGRVEDLKDLSLDKVADACLGHHGDSHGGLNLLDHVRVACETLSQTLATFRRGVARLWVPCTHPYDATAGADVCRDTLERHDRHGPCRMVVRHRQLAAQGRCYGVTSFLSDLGLFRIDDVHDHATLEHLGEARPHWNHERMRHR